VSQRKPLLTQQLLRWTHEALKGAEENLKKHPQRAKKHDSKKEYLKQESHHLIELLLE